MNEVMASNPLIEKGRPTGIPEARLHLPPIGGIRVQPLAIYQISPDNASHIPPIAFGTRSTIAALDAIDETAE
jgi:hypothetical protein